MFSRAVRRPYPEVSPPDTMLIRWRIGNGSFVTSWPATSACPDVGRRSVARILMSVVLPAPLGPRSPNSSPSRIWRDTPSSAVTGPSDSSSSGVGLRRHQRFFFPENTRVRSRVSTAYDMGDPTADGAEGGGWRVAAYRANRRRYRVTYPAIRLRIRTLRMSVSSDTFALLWSKSSVNSFG